MEDEKQEEKWAISSDTLADVGFIDDVGKYGKFVNFKRDFHGVFQPEGTSYRFRCKALDIDKKDLTESSKKKSVRNMLDALDKLIQKEIDDELHEIISKLRKRKRKKYQYSLLESRLGTSEASSDPSQRQA